MIGMAIMAMPIAVVQSGVRLSSRDALVDHPDKCESHSEGSSTPFAGNCCRSWSTCCRRRACCNACNDRCGSRRTNGQQRLGHDLVLGLAGGCAPPGAVGVGVGHWRHGGPLMSNMSTSPGVYYEGGDKDRSVYLAVYLVCICFQDKNTQIHAYLHPSSSVFNI